MVTTINNGWITLSEQRNGINVQRKFGGIDSMINEDNTVEYCRIFYWERELYPNGEIIKCEKKWYSLEDLAETINDVEQWRQEQLLVLTGFVNSLGYPSIINPSRETLENVSILPLTSYNGYPLRRDTRDKLPLNP